MEPNPNFQSDQFQQLPMFMSVGEIKGLRPNDFVTKKVYEGAIGDPSREIERGWENKLKEATWRSGRPQSLVDRVRDFGVEKPVVVGHYDEDDDHFLKDGHHRIAAAAATKGDDYLVPVLHIDQSSHRLPDDYISKR